MKARLARYTVIAGALLLSGCQTVKYPGAVDETPPAGVELSLETELVAGQSNAQRDRHPLHADMRRAGGQVTTISSESISSDARFVVRAMAQDEESGIKELRVTGAKRVCQENPSGGAPRPLDYQVPQVWLVKDFAPTGKGRIPKHVTLETKISVAALTGATRRAGSAVPGEAARFQFYVEAVNGAGQRSSSQWLEYRIGKVGCP